MVYLGGTVAPVWEGNSITGPGELEELVNLVGLQKTLQGIMGPNTRRAKNASNDPEPCSISLLVIEYGAGYHILSHMRKRLQESGCRCRSSTAFLSALVIAGTCAMAKDGPPPRLVSEGLWGYISMDVPAPPEDFGYGVGLDSTAWALVEQPLRDFQIGMKGART